MVLNYQRWTALCGCSFEQEVNTDTQEVKLLFNHNVCTIHEDIAKNTPTPQTTAKDKLRDDIIKAKHKAWADNKTKNESDFDNHKQFKQIKDKVKDIGLANLDSDTKILHDYYLDEKRKHLDAVDKFTNDKSMEMLIGLDSPYAFNANKVYDKIIEDQKNQAPTSNEGG